MRLPFKSVITRGRLLRSLGRLGEGLNRRDFLKAAACFLIGQPAKKKRLPVWTGITAKNPTLDEKIGSMLMVGFRGLRVDRTHSIAQDILRRSIGGVVLFDYDVPAASPVRNVESRDQLKSLIFFLQSLAGNSLIVAIDHEGGRITRLKEASGFPQTFSAQYFGRKNDLEFTFSQAKKMAVQLAHVGVNLNLAPVVDLNINPNNPIIGKLDRSFSEDPEKVTSHAERFIQAHHCQNVFCTLKHFPGHGSSVEDSHLGMVDISSTWSDDELRPYQNLIQKGVVDAVMTAHVFNRHLDTEFPATLSKRILTGILRKKLNYDGVVISDDMQMGAIAKIYGLETAIFRAIEAGVDILAFANNSAFDPEIAKKAIDVIKILIERKKVSEARIDSSFMRIKKLKMKMNRSNLNQ